MIGGIFYDMINYNKVAKINNLKYSLIKFLNKHKIHVIIFGVLVVISLLTGLFTGIKLFTYESDLNVEDFSFGSLTDGSIYTLRVFILRYLSMLFLLLLMFALSMSLFTSIFSYVLIAYRSFLLSLNCTLLIVFVGMSGVINGIIIILPCQILNIALLVLMFILCRDVFKEKKKCGFLDRTKFKNFWYIFILALIINVIEVVLLLLFKATTILII